MKVRLISASALLLVGAMLTGCATPKQCAIGQRPPIARRSTLVSLQRAAADDTCLQGWSWQGPSAPRGIVIIVHGLRDHALRYSELADALAANGLIVYAYDQRGHGASGGDRQRFDSVDELVADVDIEVRAVAAEHAGLPIFLYGHSLGGLVSAWYGLAHREQVRGIVLTGAAIQLPDTVGGFEKAAARFFGVLTPGLHVQSLDDTNNVREPAEKKAFAEDPLVFHENLPAASARAAVNGIDALQSRLVDFDVPVLVLHGTGDTSTSIEGSRTLVRVAKTTDKTLIEYPGVSHDLIHEPERDTVIHDAVAWITARL